MILVKIQSQSGIMGKIYSCLAKFGYIVTSNKKINQGDKAFTYIQFLFDGGQFPLPLRVESALLNIKGCFDISYEPVDISKHVSSKIKIDKTLLTNINQICNKLSSDITNAASYIERICFESEVEQVENALYAFGFELGRSVYKKDYSLGKPLDLHCLIKRCLSRELKKIGDVAFTKHTVSIENNNCCTVHEGSIDCAFTKGFIEAFLKNNQKTKAYKVSNCGCKSKGRAACSFEFVSLNSISA